ncbi:hypothetical protein [Neobacillus sp. LXY-4]
MKKIGESVETLLTEIWSQILGLAGKQTLKLEIYLLDKKQKHQKLKRWMA